MSPHLDRCQLSHLPRTPLDPQGAARQHAAYETVLERLGCRVVAVPPAPDLPDSVFVEDTAVVVDEVAIVARPGAATRRAEVHDVAGVLAGYRPIRTIEPPGTLDGGDVLRIGRTVWVGLSGRTNVAGAHQLRSVLEPLGYEVITVTVTECLHLKSAVTALPDDAVLLNPRRVDPAVFSGRETVSIDPGEPHAANVLRVGDVVVMPTEHEGTRDRVESRGVRVVEVAVSELLKAEGGVTCCSILLGERGVS